MLPFHTNFYFVISLMISPVHLNIGLNSPTNLYDLEAYILPLSVTIRPYDQRIAGPYFSLQGLLDLLVSRIRALLDNRSLKQAHRRTAVPFAIRTAKFKTKQVTRYRCHDHLAILVPKTRIELVDFVEL